MMLYVIIYVIKCVVFLGMNYPIVYLGSSLFEDKKFIHFSTFLTKPISVAIWQYTTLHYWLTLTNFDASQSLSGF